MLQKILMSVFFISSVILSSAYAGEVKMTTYYPAPYGEYKKIVTKTLGVGDTNKDGSINGSDAPDPAGNPGDVWIAGKVGIGTTEPDGILEVKGGNAQTDLNGYSIRLNAQNSGSLSSATATVGGNIYLIPGQGHPTDVGGGVMVGDAALGGLFNIHSSNAGTDTNGLGIYLYAQNAGTASQNLASNGGNIILMPGLASGTGTPGCVGIGTTTPAGTLDVQGGTAAANTHGTSITLHAQNGGSGDGNGGNIILIPGTANGTGGRGNVGIGTTWPSCALDVNGDVNVSSGCTYKINGNASYFLKGRIIFTTSAAHSNAKSSTSVTYNPSAGVRAIYVQCWGAGGGGGGANGIKGGANIGGGGGAGGYADAFITSAAGMYSSYNYSAVGIGGGGGYVGNGKDKAGTGGGDTYLGSSNGTSNSVQVLCTGGGGGLSSNGTACASGGWGGDGSAVGVYIDGAGEDGESGSIGSWGHWGLKGASTSVGGGGHHVGAGYDGDAARGFGAGGGGAATIYDVQTDYKGGDGANGLIVIWEYY